MTRYKLIYNPYAGTKKTLIKNPFNLDLLKYFAKKYSMAIDFFPTQKKGHATVLAQNALKEKYDVVIAAGGDGTVGEAANGLVGSHIPLGILPFGTFMNVARMLSIPNDLNHAMLLIKLQQVAKIDVGKLIEISGKKLKNSYYFLESAGIGIDAGIQKLVLLFEEKKYASLQAEARNLLKIYNAPVKIEMEKGEIITRAGMITVANGPVSGAGFELSPEAKLNDHKLTISIFRMSRPQLLGYFFATLRGKPQNRENMEVFHSKRVKISADDERLLHIDARWFGNLPAEFKIVPGALNVIIGFPDDKPASALKEFAYIEP